MPDERRRHHRISQRRQHRHAIRGAGADGVLRAIRPVSPSTPPASGVPDPPAPRVSPRTGLKSAIFAGTIWSAPTLVCRRLPAAGITANTRLGDPMPDAAAAPAKSSSRPFLTVIAAVVVLLGGGGGGGWVPLRRPRRRLPLEAAASADAPATRKRRQATRSPRRSPGAQKGDDKKPSERGLAITSRSSIQPRGTRVEALPACPRFCLVVRRRNGSRESLRSSRVRSRCGARSCRRGNRSPRLPRMDLNTPEVRTNSAERSNEKVLKLPDMEIVDVPLGLRRPALNREGQQALDPFGLRHSPECR